MRGILLTAIIISLSGCMQNDMIVYDYIDANQKTISVNVDATGGLSNKLTRVLRQNDFTVYIKNKQTDIGYTTIKSKYELFVNANALDMCVMGGIRYKFGISIVDLENSQEILNYSGTNCEPKIIEFFDELIKTSTK